MCQPMFEMPRLERSQWQAVLFTHSRSGAGESKREFRVAFGSGELREALQRPHHIPASAKRVPRLGLSLAVQFPRAGKMSDCEVHRSQGSHSQHAAQGPSAGGVLEQNHRLAARARDSDGRIADRLNRAVESVAAAADVTITNVGGVEDHARRLAQIIRGG